MNPIKKRGCVVPIIIFCIVLAGIFFLFQVTGENSSNTTGYELASTIRLMKIEGEVLVQNAVGNTISSNEQMKLYNGYQIITSNGSYAWLTLDDTKVVKIDANSVVGVQKKNEKITLYIDSGNLFFNVKQPLKEKESFHVKTSTMTMGIRGTSGVVTALENGKSEIRLFTGKVHVYVEEAVNDQRTTQFLVSGNILECTASDQEKKAKTKMITMREEDIPSFAAAEIVEDNLLRDKIQEETNLNVSSLTLEDSSSREQIEEDSTKENQEKSKESVVKEESQSQVTVMTDESKAGNGTIEETMPNHSFYDSSTSSDSSYKETAVNKNTQNESNKRKAIEKKRLTKNKRTHSSQKKRQVHLLKNSLKKVRLLLLKTNKKKTYLLLLKADQKKKRRSLLKVNQKRGQLLFLKNSQKRERLLFLSNRQQKKVQLLFLISNHLRKERLPLQVVRMTQLKMLRKKILLLR